VRLAPGDKRRRIQALRHIRVLNCFADSRTRFSKSDALKIIRRGTVENKGDSSGLFLAENFHFWEYLKYGFSQMVDERLSGKARRDCPEAASPPRERPLHKPMRFGMMDKVCGTIAGILYPKFIGTPLPQ